MKRKDFLKKTIATGVAALASPFVLKSENANQSTYDKLSEQVGFNHMPNNEVTTHNTVLQKANTRGSANHGWLKVNHTFSFANYHNLSG